MKMPASQRVNLDQAAQHAGISRRTLYYWMAHGSLPYVIIQGGRRVKLSHVLKLKDRHADA
jgi:predicted site-specific integrase-resolvase